MKLELDNEDLIAGLIALLVSAIALFSGCASPPSYKEMPPDGPDTERRPDFERQ